MSWTTIVTRFDGRCKHCMYPIKKLTIIKWHDERHISMHLKCWRERNETV